MSLRRERCNGVLHDRPVEVYVLTNASGAEARVATYGATLVSLRVPDRAGAFGDVVLGFDRVSRYF